MPKWAVEKALKDRMLNPSTATDQEFYALASQFGVGYQTIVKHLRYALELLPDFKLDTLLRSSPKIIKERLLNTKFFGHLVLVDTAWKQDIPIDLEVGDAAFLTFPARSDGQGLPSELISTGTLFSAAKPGIFKLTATESPWAAFVAFQEKVLPGGANTVIWRILMPKRTTTIYSTNISGAWSNIFNRVMTSPGAVARPILLDLEAVDGAVAESADIRKCVDDELKKQGMFPIDTTSFLIFPWKLWNKLGQPDLARFSDIYLKKVYPSLKLRGPKHNSRGTYFQRMIQFSGLQEKASTRSEKEVNQLERILEIWEQAEEKGRHPRHSALQATIFDPAKDHHGAALCGFPCLQQVSFDYHGNSLAINAYYPTQYLFDRGYGNYLGLCHLGQFMAKQMGLTFSGLICFIGSCHLGGGITKRALTPLKNQIDACRAPAQQPDETKS